MSKDKKQLTQMAHQVTEEKNSRKVLISVYYTDEVMSNNDIAQLMDVLDAGLNHDYTLTIEKEGGDES